MPLLPEMDADARCDVMWLVACPATSYRPMVSCDLTGFDDAGRAVFNDCFHLD
jgi:hypothetical protein